MCTEMLWMCVPYVSFGSNGRMDLAATSKIRSG